MVAIHYRQFDGGNPAWCGGTVIDSRWVLTAAHCVHDRNGRVRPARDFFIREGAANVGGGRAIDVANVVPHERFIPNIPLNDVALLQLAAPASSSPQNLLRSDARSKLLNANTVFTVIGYGLTQPVPAGALPPNYNYGPASSKLLQVDVHYVAQARCAGIGGMYNSNSITEATLCAGEERGGKDSCHGDSGGPLFVSDGTSKQPIQAGVVSWGDGCAQAGKYGVYASVGYFESWIRGKVANASFVPQAQQSGSQAATDQVLGSYVAGGDAAPPSQLAQVNVDLAPGAKARIGDTLTVRVISSVPGSLFVFNEDMTTGKSFQLFPNQLSGSNLPGQARAEVIAGRQVTIPGPTDRFLLRINPPVGKNRVVAVVVPPKARVGDLLQKNDGMQPIADLDQLLESLVEREYQSRDVAVEVAPTNRAIGVRDYEIVQ
jgi:hypothetical protein